MAKATLEEAREFQTMAPETIVGLRVKGDEIIELDGKYGPWEKLEVEFEIIDAPDPYKDLIGERIWGGIPFRFEDDPENALLQWTEAILGFSVLGNLGFQLDTDDWRGKECRGVTGTYTKRDGNERHKIESLLPAAGGVEAPNAGTDASWPATASPASDDVTDDDVPF